MRFRAGGAVLLAVVVLTASGCGPATAPPSGTASTSPTVVTGPTVSGGVLGPAATLVPQMVPSGTAAPGPSASAAGAGRSGAGGDGVAVRPQQLVLPSGTVAQVDPAGLYPDGSLKVPDLPSRVGWWTGGALAGDPYGSTVIAGHVDSRVYGLGALHELAAVDVGDVIGIRGSGRTVQYRVDSIRSVPQARLDAETSPFRQDVAARLVVITCGGPFDRRTHHYQENVVVTAVPIPA